MDKTVSFKIKRNTFSHVLLYVFVIYYLKGTQLVNMSGRIYPFPRYDKKRKKIPRVLLRKLIFIISVTTHRRYPNRSLKHADVDFINVLIKNVF